MGSYQVEVKVTPRATLLDPQGQAVEHALNALGFEEATEVRVGRFLTMNVLAMDASDAQRSAQRMCEKLLANPVTEDFSVGVVESA